MSAPPDAAASLARLAAVLRGYGSVLVFSGGIDSALVLAAAHRVLGPQALGLTAVGPRSPRPSGRRRSRSPRRRRPPRARRLERDRRPAYVANAGPLLPLQVRALPRRRGRPCGAGVRVVANGRTSTTSATTARASTPPAAGARSPLVEAELDKEAVRRVARHLGVRIWDKPAAACLASRIRTGPPSPEAASARSRPRGRAARRGHSPGAGPLARGRPPQSRRPRSPAIARVEVAADELERAFGLRERIAAAGRAAGFAYVTLDPRATARAATTRSSPGGASASSAEPGGRRRVDVSVRRAAGARWRPSAGGSGCGTPGSGASAETRRG